MKKKAIRTLLWIFAMFAVTLTVMLCFIRLEPQYERTSFAMPLLTQQQKNEIKAETSSMTDERELFEYAVKKTAK